MHEVRSQKFYKNKLLLSRRSPSPHKCLLETSFCGNRPSLTDNLLEATNPEDEDLEKVLLKREADTTKALIPENIKVPIVDGNIKPDPLDKPRRRGREERKEIFRREVEITKKVLERVNIEVSESNTTMCIASHFVNRARRINILCIDDSQIPSRETFIYPI